MSRDRYKRRQDQPNDEVSIAEKIDRFVDSYILTPYIIALLGLVALIVGVGVYATRDLRGDTIPIYTSYTTATVLFASGLVMLTCASLVYDKPVDYYPDHLQEIYLGFKGAAVLPAITSLTSVIIYYGVIIKRVKPISAISFLLVITGVAIGAALGGVLLLLGLDEERVTEEYRR